jgi:hypothetical protein
MIAAHAQRVQAVMDAFRLAGATDPDRARTLAALAVRHAAEAEELARGGVLLPGPGRDTWYLSEAAVVARRGPDARPARSVVIVIMLLVALGALAVGVLLANRHS